MQASCIACPAGICFQKLHHEYSTHLYRSRTVKDVPFILSIEVIRIDTETRWITASIPQGKVSDAQINQSPP